MLTKVLIAIAIFFTIYGLVLFYGQRMERTKEEVLDFLSRMASGEVDPAGWDRFLNIPIKDKYLDSIRKRCEVFWEYDEFLAENSDGDFILNNKGISEVQELINELNQHNT
jgi:hypothetical protein